MLDAVLVSFALACALGLWWSCRQKHAAERQMDHLLLNMKRAEEELRQLQAKLEYVEDMGVVTHVVVMCMLHDYTQLSQGCHVIVTQLS